MLTIKKVSKKSQSGVTMIEYALIAALIAIASITVLTPIVSQILAKFQDVLTALGGSTS